MTKHSGRVVVCLAALAAAWLLASCGGGGAAPNGCSNGSDVHTNLVYPDAFNVYEVSVGVPIVPMPAQTDGVPTACLSSRHFSIASGTLAPGLSLDPNIGTISGTPSTVGYTLWIVQMDLTGFIGAISGGISSRVSDPTRFGFSSWAPGVDLPYDPLRLDGLGNALVLTGVSSRGTLFGAISSDEGASWRDLSAGAPLNAQGYATAHDSVAIYGAGGRSDSGALRNDVWKIDIAGWSTRTVAAAFSPRRDAAMFTAGTALYVVGGSDAAGSLNDVWRSTDGGQTWRQATAAFAPAAEPTVCGFQLGSALVVVTSRPGGIGVASTTDIWTSVDGINWSAVSVGATSALRALDPVLPQCLVSNGRAYLFGSKDVVSTSDLVTWQFEPRFQFDTNPGGGGAAISGRLHVIDGLQTSQRSLHRTLP